MGIPFPIFNFPILGYIIDITNNIYNSKLFKGTKRVVIDTSKYSLVWLISTFSYISFFLAKKITTVAERLTKDLYYIRYLHNGKFYRIVFPIKRFNETNIVKVLSIFDDTTDIIEYLGPNNDFHGVKLTPNSIKQKPFSITYFKDEDLETITKTFSEHDVLSLN
jgi:hypothetical protein